jgi:non-specific serine/threonine protein kinase
LSGELAEPATPLVGCEHLITEAADLLRRPEVRLLTLTGTGGVGKTRVGLRVAQELRHEYADGASLVGLAAVKDPALVIPTVARTLGLRETGSRPVFERLLDHLSEKEMLLVLDNFEQVRASSPLLLRLISGCPRLKALLTSRVALRVRGEQQFGVPPLGTPAPRSEPDAASIEGSPAVALFVGRARAVDPTFRLTDANAPAVAEICRRLDGLPLAIELAASRVKLLPPEDLLERLASGLGLLAGGGPDLPERQRTMRRAIAWSYDLLNEGEQALFRRLSVFAGGCTLEAAEAVCSSAPAERLDIFDGLSSLIDASLLRREAGPKGESRLTMLVVLREYAYERLSKSAEATAAHRRHADYFARMAETAYPALLGPGHSVWAQRLEREHDNLREALRWAREVEDTETGLRLIGSLGWFWWIRGYLDEGRRWAEEFVSQDSAGASHPVSSGARANALHATGELALGQGDLAYAAKVLEESLALYRQLGDEGEAAIVLAVLGQVTRAQGSKDRAATLSEEALSLSRKAGERLGAAIAHNTLGHIERHRGNDAAATANYQESLDLFRELGDERGCAYTLANLGVAALNRGERERALGLHEDSLALYQKLGDKTGMALVLANLGDVAHEEGDAGRATVLYEDALALYRELGNERGVARTLERLAAQTR